MWEVAHNGSQDKPAFLLNKSIDRGGYDIFSIYGLGEYNIAKDAWSVQLKEKNNHMIGEIPDMPKKTLKEMENRLKIYQEKGRRKRKDKESSICEPRSSVIEEFVSLSLNSSIGKLFGAAASC